MPTSPFELGVSEKEQIMHQKASKAATARIDSLNISWLDSLVHVRRSLSGKTMRQITITIDFDLLLHSLLSKFI